MPLMGWAGQLVRIPMMPKGVEHYRSDELKRVVLAVRIPMMPKGVEHCRENTFIENPELVRIPMMPKGVEHLLPAASSRASALSENSDDAERR